MEGRGGERSEMAVESSAVDDDNSNNTSGM